MFREKKEREEKKEELRQKAAAGDLKAKSELKRMELQEVMRCRVCICVLVLICVCKAGAAAASAADEALSIQKKLAAKRALSNTDDDKKR